MKAGSETRELTLHDVMRDAQDGIFAIDRQRRVVVFAEGCARITGADPSALIDSGCACHKLTRCHDEQGRVLSGALCPALRIFDGDIESARQRMSVQHADGRQVWVETTYSGIRNDNGTITHVVGIMRDITEAKTHEQDLKEVVHRLGGTSATAAPAPATAGPIVEVSADAAGMLDRMLGSIERKEILGALDRASGQRTLAAKLLGISRSRLYRRMEALDIDPRNATAAKSD